MVVSVGCSVVKVSVAPYSYLALIVGIKKRRISMLSPRKPWCPQMGLPIPQTNQNIQFSKKSFLKKIGLLKNGILNKISLKRYRGCDKNLKTILYVGTRK